MFLFARLDYLVRLLLNTCARPLRWAADHDYRLETELHRAMARRQRIIAQVLSAPPLPDEGASMNSSNHSSSSSSSSSSGKNNSSSPQSHSIAPISSPQRGSRAISVNGHSSGGGTSSGSPLGNGNNGQRKRSDSSADDIGVATMVAALGRGLRQSQPSTSSSSSSRDSSAGNEALLAAASPRALVGLAGELLKHMGGASPETQRRRFKVGRTCKRECE